MQRPRISIAPGDIPPTAAARRMGLSTSDFETALPELLKRGFPAPDATTGNFDLDAVDEWRRRRHPSLYESSPVPNGDALLMRIDQEIGFG